MLIQAIVIKKSLSLFSGRKVRTRRLLAKANCTLSQPFFMLSYLLLFFWAFLAATFFPISSEIYLVTLLQQDYSCALVITVASIGNTAGAALNYALGRFLLSFEDRPWFYFSTSRRKKAQTLFNRYGTWTLLFTWLPVIGDALAFVAGIMKTPVLLFLPLTGIGKTLRYIFVAYAARELFF